MKAENVAFTSDLITKPLGAAFLPYDYVEDIDGWTYLVKGVVAGTDLVVGKAMYSACPSRMKCKTHFPKHVQQPHARRYTLAGPMDYIIPTSLIARAYVRSDSKLTTGSHDSDVLTKITEPLDTFGCSIHLFGSRRLNLHHSESDLDVLIVSNHTARDIVSCVIKNLKGSARRFTSEECLARASRYSRPAGPFSYDCLARLFNETTMYLKTSYGEVGLFFAGPTESCLPDPDALQGCSQTLIGKILPSDGRSHHLPRLIRLLLNDGNEISVSTILWELGGLEELAGTSVRMRGLRPVAEGHWWMGGPESDLEILCTT